MADRGTVRQLNVSAGGVPKRAVPVATVTRLGLEGDRHRDHQHHGGLERAVCLFSWETIQDLAAEGHAITPGAIGENVTIQGLDWSLVVPGAHLLLGRHVLLYVTRYTSPCSTIAPVFLGHEFSRVSQKRHPGCSRVYARVLCEGDLRSGDPVRLVSEHETDRLVNAHPGAHA